MDQELDVRDKTMMNLLKGNIRLNFSDLRLGNGFIDITQKAQAT